MHTWVEGWDWLWMTLMMGFWLVVLGAVIFIAVRLAPFLRQRVSRTVRARARERSCLRRCNRNTPVGYAGLSEGGGANGH